MTVWILDSVQEYFGISEREFNSIVDFAFKELRLPNNIDIFFEFEQIEDFLGFTHNHDCKNNQYCIIVAPGLKWHTMAKTIFHEMVHIRQDVNNDRFNDTWKGVPVDIENCTYDQLPWEIEAFELEEELFQKYVSGD